VHVEHGSPGILFNFAERHLDFVASMLVLKFVIYFFQMKVNLMTQKTTKTLTQLIFFRSNLILTKIPVFLKIPITAKHQLILMR